MNQLACPFADDVNAEEPSGFAVENQLKQTSDVAEDLAPRISL
jgi:hypothetical protein